MKTEEFEPFIMLEINKRSLKARQMKLTSENSATDFSC